MKKKLFIAIVVFFTLIIILGLSYRTYEKNENVKYHADEIRMIAWNSLTDGDKTYSGQDWKSAKLELARWKDVPSLYMGEQGLFNDIWLWFKQDDVVVRVIFDKNYDPTLGPITKYVDPESKKVIGYGLLF